MSLEELRAAAEAARAGYAERDADWQVWNERLAAMTDYHAAASPDVVLALIEVAEAARAHLDPIVRDYDRSLDHHRLRAALDKLDAG